MSQSNISWLFKMAWRDSRRNRGRLLLFISSIILGIAALVAINSFSENLHRDINKEAKTLLGADLVIEGNQPAPDSILHTFDSIGVEPSTNVIFISMVLFPENGNSRMAVINALEGDFPFYGNFNTEPKTAAQSFRDGAPKALVDKSLMTQFKVKNGDTVKIGDQYFTVEGKLNAMPGQAQISSTIAPSIYIPQKYLSATNLVQTGSRLEYKYFFKLPDAINADTLMASIRPALTKATMRGSTVESRREAIGQAFDNMNSFLSLVGFIALLLGCIGVASAVHIYIRDKISIVAILRCLGASGRQAFLIYLIQIAVMGLVGSAIGAVLGSLLQKAIPLVLGDFLPVAGVSNFVSWSAIAQGVITGTAIAILFALLPLLAIQGISPLRALRASFEENKTPAMAWAVYLAIFAFVFGFSYVQTGGGITSLLFPVGIGFAFLLLAGAAKLLIWLVKRFFPTNSSYVVRQGVANLFRPNNQTLILMISIGLGTTLITTLFFTQDLLLSQIRLSGSGAQPNMILFDITPEQKEGIKQLATSNDLPIIQDVPIVTIRVENIKGITKQENALDTINGRKGWVFRREYRVTYRDTLSSSETLVKGEPFPGNPRNEDGAIYISLAEDIAEDFKVDLGDEMVFNVQGALMKGVVHNIREIDWKRMQTNFFVLFPSGILEKAPQFNVLVSRTESEEQLASFQQVLVQNYPNVSLVDLTSVLKSVDQVLSKVSFVIRFMAFFSILTGLLVLISSVVLSKYQRIRESVLLRTLGAQSRQILYINALEYFLLGSLAALTGLLLSIVGSFLLATFLFEIPYAPAWGSIFFVIFSITLLTVVIGLLNSRDILRKPPLEVLRAEV